MKNKKAFHLNFKMVGLFIVSLFLATSNQLLAQSEAEISGSVIEQSTGEPIFGANVLVVNKATGFKAGTATDVDGSYLIRDLQLGGPYEITVSYVGYQTIVQQDIELNLSDVIDLNFTLKEGEELEEVVITASSGSSFRSKKRLGSAVAITGKTLEKIPTTTRNYEDLANLSPLSTPNLGLSEGSSFGGVSIAGSNGGTTGFTIDGVNNRRQVFGGTVDGPAFSISLEAIKEFEIVTNEYDVTGPRGSGGSIKAVTKSGSNNWSGAAWGYLSGGGLSGNRNFNGTDREVDFSNSQYGFRVGGPIIKDKLSFIAVYDQFNQTSPVGSGSNSSGFINFDSGQNLPFTENDVQNYVDHLNTLGVLSSNDLSSQIGEFEEERATRNIFLRADWNINANNNLSLSYNFLDYEDSFEAGADGFDNATLFSRGYPFLTKDKKFIGTLKTRLKKGSNSLKVSIGRTERENSLVATRTPRVSVAALDNVNEFRVGAGLATWVPEELYSNIYQVIDVLTKQIGKNTYTFGADLLFTTVDENIPHNTASSFRYDNLNDFIAGRPNFWNKKYTLDPNDDERLKYTSSELAFFAQGEFNLTDDLKLEAGLRWDGTIFSPDEDPTNPRLVNGGSINGDPQPPVLDRNGEPLVNDSELRDFNNIQPRLSLTWDKAGEGNEIFKFGIGFFSSQFTTQPYTFSLGNSGSRFVEVSTTDRDVLEGIHSQYTQNGGWANLENQISLQEYASLSGQNIDEISPDIVVLDPEFDMPVTFKLSASYHRYFNDWLRLGGSFYYNNTKNVPFYDNINLQEVGVNPLDGRITYSNGANPLFGNIHVFRNSDWRASFVAGSLEAFAKLPKGGNINLSYTRSSSKGFSYYNAGGGIENGKPLSYSYESYPIEADRWQDANSIPNKIVFSFVSPEIAGFTLSGSLVAGQFGRFSAFAPSSANGGIGGDNLAYIPTESEVENAILDNPNTGQQYRPYENFNLLLASTSQEFREYINENRGQFADYNAGVQPWSYVTNLSLIKAFKFADIHKISLRMDIFNLLNIFDFKDGGFDVVSNTNLINVNNGVYSVNTEAGRYSDGGDQFRIQFGLKYEF